MNTTLARHVPSKGRTGERFILPDGSHYVRTPFGLRKLPPAVGWSIAFADIQTYRRQRRTRALLWITLTAFAVLFFVLQ